MEHIQRTRKKTERKTSEKSKKRKYETIEPPRWRPRQVLDCLYSAARSFCTREAGTDMADVAHTKDVGLSGAIFGTGWARVPGRVVEDRRVGLLVRVRVWVAMVWRNSWGLRILPSPG